MAYIVDLPFLDHGKNLSVPVLAAISGGATSSRHPTNAALIRLSFPTSAAATAFIATVNATRDARNDPADPDLTVDKSSFLTTASTGAIVASLTDPFTGSTYSVLSGDAQLALSGSNIVRTSTAAASGTSYSIKIRATSSDAKREVAETFSFTASGAAATATVPAAPTLTVEAGDAQATLTFSDGATGGAAITGHKLYRGTAAGAETLIGTIATGSPYIDTGLTNGTTYYYHLRAVNAIGEGAKSASVSVALAAPVDASFPSTADYLAISARPTMQYASKTNAYGQYCWGVITWRAPAWATKAPSLGFFGGVGAGSVGEQALGSDMKIEGAYFEVNGTKYWLGPNGYSTTTPIAFTVPNGGVVTTAKNLDDILIPANAWVRVGIADDQGGANGGSYYRPVGSVALAPVSAMATPQGKGDAGGNATTSRLATMQADAANTFAAPGVNSPAFFPQLICAKPATAADAAKARAVLTVGMSVDTGANQFVSAYARRASEGWNVGDLALGLYAAGVPDIHWSIPGTKSRDTLNGGGPLGSTKGEAGFAMRNALLEAMGWPFTTAMYGGPCNDDSTTASESIGQAVAGMKARGNRRVVMCKMRPNGIMQEQSNSAANTYFGAGGDSHQVAAGVIAKLNRAMMAMPAGLDAIIDMKDAYDSPGTYGADAPKMKADDYSATLAADVAVGALSISVTNVTGLDVGDAIVIDPVVGTTGEFRYVKTISGTGPFTVEFTANAGAGGALVNAHVAGSAVLGTYFGGDMVHLSPQGHRAGAPIIAAAVGTAIK